MIGRTSLICFKEMGTLSNLLTVLWLIGKLFFHYSKKILCMCVFFGSYIFLLTFKMQHNILLDCFFFYFQYLFSLTPPTEKPVTVMFRQGNPVLYEGRYFLFFIMRIKKKNRLTKIKWIPHSIRNKIGYNVSDFACID